MIHECNVFCHSVESDMMDLFGKDDPNVGKWLPFSFDISLIDAIKMSTDDKESMIYKCTTIFLSNGNTYIIDTKYRDLLDIWKEYVTPQSDSNDLDL